MNILRHKGINITFIIQYFWRSVNLFILIHPDGGALFWCWLKNFCKYFLRKPYIQGLKCRYSEGLTFMLIVLLQDNQKNFPKNLHLLPLFCRYSEDVVWFL